MLRQQEELRGKDVSNLIEQVQSNRTLVNMRLHNTDLELLTLIHAIQPSRKGHMFGVDLPPDLKQRVAVMYDGVLIFEFVDSNRVPCKFTALPVEASNDTLWVLFPEVIYREQKREHFRIEAPLRTRFCFKRDEEFYRMPVSDISMGGALVTRRIAGGRDQVLHVGDRLRDVEITFPSHCLKVREAVVVRQEERVPRTLFFGIQFKSLKQNEKRALKHILYDLQRKFLARRAGTA